ncbi:MAG: T9SS type A sorting domain-containing protein, partial [Dinghuibacter sp.]|nr:T9SS type A sorting domain-containing protein [Dinghuibacter sp.]
PTLLSGNTPLNIEVEAQMAAETVISVHNMQGQQVLQTREQLNKGANRIQLDISALPRGTFIVALKTGEEVQKAQVIKQ